VGGGAVWAACCAAVCEGMVCEDEGEGVWGVGCLGGILDGKGDGDGREEGKGRG